MKKGIGLLALGLALTLFGGSAKADYVVYTDRVTFQTALNSQTTETFNELGGNIHSYANGFLSQAQGLTQPITVIGGYAYLLSGSAGSLGGFYPSYGTFLLGGIGTAPNLGTTVTLPSNTYTALGVDVTAYATNAMVSFSGITSHGEAFSGTTSVTGADPNGPLGFLGVSTNSSTDYINSIVFTVPPGTNVNVILDNVSFGQAIPEPASMALFATGGLILAAGVLRRRFRSAKV